MHLEASNPVNSCKKLVAEKLSNGWSKIEANASVLPLEFLWGTVQEAAALEITMKSIKGIENVQMSVAAGVTNPKVPHWYVLVGESGSLPEL